MAAQMGLLKILIFTLSADWLVSEQGDAKTKKTERVPYLI